MLSADARASKVLRIKDWFGRSKAPYYPANFADFALSPCTGEVGGDVVSPTTSPFISAAAS
jgi:hypothetical protein